METRLRERAPGIGASLRRVDGVPKVTGAFSYASDLSADGMLWGGTLRSPYPHARVRSVDTSAALAIPGVAAVLVAADIPGKRTFGLNFDDQPVLASDLVRYQGEPVALVAATTPELARHAVRRIAVDWEPLGVLADMEAALRSDAPRLHDFGNVLRHIHLVHGQPDQTAADVWVEGYYETAMQDQAPLGPEAGLAVPDADGGVHLHVATQWLHADREQIAPCLGLPLDKVRRGVLPRPEAERTGRRRADRGGARAAGDRAAAVREDRPAQRDGNRRLLVRAGTGSRGPNGANGDRVRWPGSAAGAPGGGGRGGRPGLGFAGRPA